MLRYKLTDKSRIRTSVRIINPLATHLFKDITAVWDTGATNTTVTPEVADFVLLPVVGRSMVGVAGSEELHPIDLVYGKVELEDGAALTSTFCKNKLPKGIDMLIGMDLISKDCFTLYTEDQYLVFEFGCMEDVDKNN